MPGVNLLALIDDIATVLDDVAVLSKVAAKKTAGVLGDDLALNAQQVSGVKAQRELPVVWAVTKGSFINKLILVPAALLISAVYPPLITILMVLGGLYLCFEGAEKVTHKFLQSKEDKAKHHQEVLEKLTQNNVDLVQLEQDKIKGAIRTDFILSAEIVVIVLGSVKEASFETQIAVLSGLAIAFTVGVYGLVAGIVKLDDLGLYLLKKSKSGHFNQLQRACGRGLLIFAPMLMKMLSVVGTLAMFLVGGGILVHSLAFLHHSSASVTEQITALFGNTWATMASVVHDGVIGLIAGLIILALITIYAKIIGKQEQN
ncbi:DUF808 domain-containing protein [Thalassotalea sp. 1_MG-2023]|uniref:DUF808 domain-containing protein n=1 Tax=Thalassotalea sp. 1_MG-2023 TaxID=3062680 RepID=UPI0026E409EA|nr:DUF808 domain-containing protein [Thalassotalea sp. 1_MG-2023]MDO6428829.1 DUF808 domain-containing protein [Thalassotalea sp. 1_MG-2023]